MTSLVLSIHILVSEIKKEMLISSYDRQVINRFVSPSAYDTAWLAMIPDPTQSSRPLFKGCLDWVLNNQNEGGFWGESFSDGRPTIDTLPATLACLLALKTWNLGEENVRKGLAFLHCKAEIILKINYQHLPRWFVVVFPGMVELAQAKGLDLALQQGSESLLSDFGYLRQQILSMENVEDNSWQYEASPILSYLESLPSPYHDDQQNIVNNLSQDGSLFQSPSATARAYMVTGNFKCLKYLKSLVQIHPNGVPANYPVDEQWIQLSTVDHVQRLGLAEYFSEEIDHILKQIYRDRRNQELEPTETYLLSKKLYKDALAFRLLRMQGYHVEPSSFCWFLQYPDFLEYIEKNFERHTSLLYAVHRATDLTFNGEFELEEARSFSRKLLLAKSTSMIANRDDIVIFSGLQKLIKHELGLPWIARLDHLEHRMWIEESKNSPLWIAKASFYRVSCLNSEKLMKLAVENYKFRQSIYAKELEELKRWSKESGFADIGFGREKTTYLYFSIAASSCLPHDSLVRLIVAKTGIVVTVADDFYDMEGSMAELEALTDAVQRWDGKNLKGNSKTIFDALDDLVTKTAASTHHIQQEGSNFLKDFKDIWRETFLSWMVEKTWSETGYRPSMDEYLEIGMISIAAHALVLPAPCFLGENMTTESVKPARYSKITKLLMAATRLVNDTQSYQKEQLDGKINMVLLHLSQNSGTQMDDSIAYVKEMADEKTKELLQIALTDGCSDMPKAFRHLHLSCIKVFQMFFNSTNLFDSKEELMEDIKKAIYIPPHHTETPAILVKPLIPSAANNHGKQETFKISACFEPKKIKAKNQGGKVFMAHQLFKNPIPVCDGGAFCSVPLRF